MRSVLLFLTCMKLVASTYMWDNDCMIVFSIGHLPLRQGEARMNASIQRLLGSADMGASHASGLTNGMSRLKRGWGGGRRNMGRGFSVV